MSSAALLLLVPLAWLAVTLFVVAACRVTALAEAEGPRPPVGGAGGLGAISSTTTFAAGGYADNHAGRLRRQSTDPVRVGSH
jgi:hypothetical protein